MQQPMAEYPHERNREMLGLRNRSELWWRPNGPGGNFREMQVESQIEKNQNGKIQNIKNPAKSLNTHATYRPPN